MVDEDFFSQMSVPDIVSEDVNHFRSGGVETAIVKPIGSVLKELFTDNQG